MALGLYTTFTLDMVPGGAPPIIHVSAEDIGRKYTVNLTYNGEVYEVQGNSLTIAGTKPDGTVFEYPVDDFEQGESLVDFLIEEQMAIVPGTVRCKLREYLNDDQIGSATFILDVDEYVYDPEAASESYIPSYETAIQEALENVADDIADLATAAAINDVKQYSDAASESATAAAESAAEAFSGTPEGYSTLVSAVTELNGNAKDSAVKMFPKEGIASNTDLNNVVIGDYYCSNSSIKNSLSNLPSGVGSVFRLQVFSITRDGITAPAEAVPWIRRVQILTESTGTIYLRFGSRGNSSTSMEWGDWTKMPPPSYGSPTLASGWSVDNANYYETANAWCHICSRLKTSSAVTVSNGFIFATGFPKPRTGVFFNAVTSHDQLVQCVIDINGTLKSYWPTANGTSLVANTVVDFDVTYRLA